MPCYHPLSAFKSSQGVSFSELRRNGVDSVPIQLACGQCIGCRLRRSQDWALRCVHEAALWPRNCFVTLTYGRDKVPAGGSLCYADYQAYMRRLRKAVSPFPVRFFMCGEYGPLNGRPHYHAVLFNVDFDDRELQGKSKSGQDVYGSKVLERLWGHGRVSVQNFCQEAAAYTARYVVDKILGEDAEVHYGGRVPEFGRCSLKPGIGALWYSRFGRDVRCVDGVVYDGVVRSVPKYYDRLHKRLDEREAAFVKDDRVQVAAGRAADNTSARLAVKEVVKLAQIQSLDRSSVDE